eukprot:174236_1
MQEHCTPETEYSNHKELQTKKPIHGVVFWFGLIFETITCALLIIFIPSSIWYCQGDYSNEHKIVWIIFVILYVLHYYLLLLILFLRLYYSFSGTGYDLSKFAVRTYTIMYIIQPISLLVSTLLYGSDKYKNIGLALTVLSGLLLIALMISVTLLYVLKLIQIYKLSKGDEYFMKLITKTTILTVITITFTFLMLIPFILVNKFNGYTYWIFELWLIVDIYINCIAIIITYKFTQKYYLKICGCCQIKCRTLCMKIVHNDEINVVKNINITNTTDDAKHTNQPDVVIQP